MQIQVQSLKSNTRDNRVRNSSEPKDWRALVEGGGGGAQGAMGGASD